MAIIKLGELVTGIRGSVGGIVFSANGSSSYAKVWAMPSNPRSQLQSAIRTIQSNCRGLWLDLTDQQRTDWNTFAADPDQALQNSLGEEYFASGWNWFVKSNSRLMHIGTAPIADAPVIARPAAPTIDALHYAEIFTVFTCVLNFQAGEFGDDSLVLHAYVVTGGAPTAAYPSRLRHVKSSATIAGVQVTFSFAPEHIALWGYAAEGWLLYCMVYRQTQEGLRSAGTPIFETYPTI